MQKFHGDLLIGGLAIRHLEGTLVEGASAQQREWSGQFQLESSQEEVLEIGRQYLLMLDDGRNAEVMVIRPNSIHLRAQTYPKAPLLGKENAQSAFAR